MSFTANNTYGEYKHKLTVNEMPNHNHTNSNANYAGFMQATKNWTNTGDINLYIKTETAGKNYGIYAISSTGGSASHNNIQPSICVYLWRRKS